jgi:crotonobetainyl-CoA:carnitine CoA-transferase CaiB-like acyl-CoA transferase
MNEPLGGIRVIEMAVAVQGPAAGLYLRDMGAEVIKVEPPLGDPSRYGRGHDNDTPPETLGPQFVAVNRGKRSVCVDLSTGLGRRALRALLDTADVFLTNYREEALVRLGLGYDELHARCPRLVYASVNGFGPSGPDAHRAMLDGAAVARGGLSHMTGPKDGPPVVLGAIVGDTAGAMHLALATLTALFVRERTGIGQRVQTSALGTQLWLQQWELTHTAMTGARLARAGAHHPNIKGPYGIYPTRCGGAIMLAQTMVQEAWDAICVFADLPHLAIDPRFDTPGKRLGEGITVADSEEVREALRQAFASRTAAEWDAFLRTQPEAIWERVRGWHEVLEDEQNLVNGYVTTIDVPQLGATKTVGNLVALSETPGSVKGGPPLLGEANGEVLGALGFSADEIAEADAHARAVREEAFALLRAMVDPPAE